jgi:hypothetical protein
MNISAEAKADQAAGGYSTDHWTDIVIPAGSLLYAGYHGAPGYGRYFTNRDTVIENADGRFSFFLWGMLQVRPHSTHGDRQQIREFRVLTDCPASGGSASANAMAYWGGGGAYQFFIPDRCHIHLMVTRILPLNSTGVI